MFSWYRQAQICFVHLYDVMAHPSESELVMEQLRKSSWFGRCWTLQELIAPRYAMFVNTHWKEIGIKDVSYLPYDRKNHHLIITDVLAEKTGIPKGILDGTEQVAHVCATQRMSWAAYRVTAREEHMAYCLLGLVEINMPLMYGEGERAFVRLQTEIVHSSGDELILSWSPLDTLRPYYQYWPILASSPIGFGNAGHVVGLDRVHSRPPPVLNSLGMKIQTGKGIRGGILRHRTDTPTKFIVRLKCVITIDIETDEACADVSPCVLYLRAHGDNVCRVFEDTQGVEESIATLPTGS
jgi:hypothetical protein